jgi:1-acyl-sn-glycerol-3-phosphate acyltransferase
MYWIGSEGTPAAERWRGLPIPGVMDTAWRRFGAHAIATLLHYGVQFQYHIEVSGLEHFTCSPSTLVVANHRRDSDGPIIGTMLADRLRACGVQTAPCFVAREDLFHRGFLRDYLTSLPRFLRDRLSSTDLRPFLDAIHLYPMRRIRERSLGEVLEDIQKVFGDLPLEEVLRPIWLARVRALASPEALPLRVSTAFDGRYRALLQQNYGLTKLTWARFRALRPYEEKTIREQLLHFVKLLEQGAVVQLEPEGTTSSDGSFGRLRGGLHVLLNQPRVPIRVLPIGITYDFMTSGRQWAFVNLGPEILDLQGLNRRETTARVTEMMLARSTLTASQLASKWLLAVRERGGHYVTRTELEDHTRREAERLSAQGMHVDPRLLAPAARSQRIVEYLEYCRRARTLLPRGRGRYLVPRGIETPAPTWTHPQSALKYVNNELLSLASLWPEVAGRTEL